MLEDIKYVLENYPDANLNSESARENIAQAIINYLTSHHIVFYTDLDAVEKDDKMLNWIKNYKMNRKESNDSQMELPF